MLALDSVMVVPLVQGSGVLSVCGKEVSGSISAASCMACVQLRELVIILIHSICTLVIVQGCIWFLYYSVQYGGLVS